MKHKITLGPSIRPVFAILVAGRRLRGTPFDPFGYASVRRVERALIAEYRDIVETLLRSLSLANVGLATQIAALPDLVRGYEHVKLANVETYHVQITELLARYMTTVDRPPQSSEAARP
jgi:indolepyruvate ferredoxin oxidoreductase